ncbi:MAG: biopolymer transporter ExbD [Chthoniobacteraceae bacterium]|nr:biopolymer transporter ExbD [Chthoniobacteraceae bacterium]
MTPIPSPRGRKRARLEIIPLIDIVFFLLATFVMVSLSMVKNRGIAVNLPAAATGAAQEQAHATTLSLRADGQLFWDKQPIDAAQLEPALRQLLAEQGDPRIFINGDTKAEFGQAVAVLDTVRKLGISKVAIQTQPGATPPPAP